MHTHTSVRRSVYFIDCYEDRLYISVRKSQQRISKRIVDVTSSIAKLILRFLHRPKEEALVWKKKRWQITFVFLLRWNFIHSFHGWNGRNFFGRLKKWISVRFLFAPYATRYCCLRFFANSQRWHSSFSKMQSVWRSSSLASRCISYVRSWLASCHKFLNRMFRKRKT